ncbi:acyltransferase [Pseudomonas matsuisoli]|uniref:Acyltransferase n=2 Tax=Pseudomonas matsuisoli TaxID=1515666 RepID=A0A917PRB7_9PSED|nr:acyltransferase [Pseudomonas matsuisoli]
MQIFYDFKSDNPLGQFLSERGAVGVDVFFVISGLVIYLSTQGREQPTREFLINRIIRIAPAYWLYSLIVAAILVFAHRVMPIQVFEWHHLLRSLFFIPAQNPAGYGFYPTLPVGWTLNYEMFFYTVFGVLFFVRERWRLPLLVVTLLLVNLVLARQPWFSDFYRNSILFEFLLGVFIGVLYRKGWLMRSTWLPVLVLVAAAAAIYAFDESSRFLHWGLPSAAIVFALISLEPWFAGRQWLKRLGDRSYSVYLVHVILLSLAWYIQQRLDLNAELVLLACIPFIHLASSFSYEWVEKRLGLWMKGRLLRETNRNKQVADAAARHSG